MARIIVEGLGEVEIAGETPTEEEELIIMEQAVDRMRLGTALNPGEARPISEVEFDQARTREQVEALPAIPEFLLEAAPAMSVGTAGAVIGAAGGPIGVAVGAGMGGLLGEILGVGAGLTPDDDLARQMAALTPIAGVGAGATAKLGRRAIGGAAGMLPPFRAALGRMTQREAVEEFESLGANVISRQSGLTSRSAGDLYESAARTGAVVPVKELKNTIRGLMALQEEVKIISAFPEAKAITKLIDNTVDAFAKEMPVSFDTFVKLRQLIGAAVQKAESGAGIRLGAAKRLFKDMTNDLETIARGATKARRPAAVALAAAERAKLEFSVRDLERAVSKFTRDVPGEEGVAELNIRGLQKWFKDITNPKSVKFDKNLSVALEDEIPRMRTHLSDLAKLAEQLNPAGPGSIVIRGIGAKSGRSVVTPVVGAVLGVELGGVVGGLIGGVAGASIPEMMTAMLTSPAGARMLKRAVRLGRGEVPAERWAFIGQAMNQLAGKGEQRERSLRTISDLQRQGTAAVGLEF